MESPDINLITTTRTPVYRKPKYKPICQRFKVWCDEQGLPLTMGNEVEWLKSLKDQGLSAATIRLYGYAVKAYLLDNMDETEMTPDEIAVFRYRIEMEFRSFKMPQIVNRKQKERLITEEEFLELLTQSRVRTRIIIEFLATTGCRVSEMIGIRHRHIRKIRESEYRIRIMGKGSKERFIRITGGLRKRIYKAFPDTRIYLFESSPGKCYSRQTIHELVQRAGERVGINGLHPHSLRHYFATYMIDKTGDINAVSQYLGHSEVSTTLGMYYHNKQLTIEQLNFNLYGNRGKKRGATHA